MCMCANDIFTTCEQEVFVPSGFGSLHKIGTPLKTFGIVLHHRVT